MRRVSLLRSLMNATYFYFLSHQHHFPSSRNIQENCIQQLVAYTVKICTPEFTVGTKKKLSSNVSNRNQRFLCRWYGAVKDQSFGMGILRSLKFFHWHKVRPPTPKSTALVEKTIVLNSGMSTKRVRRHQEACVTASFTCQMCLGTQAEGVCCSLVQPLTWLCFIYT